MRKFRFKLQTVLDHRKFVEDRLQAELAELRREESIEAARLARLRAKLDLAQSAMLEALARNEPPESLKRRDEYAKAARDDVKVQELTLKSVREKVEAKRAEVVEAMKRRKVLEALRDKQESIYLRECARVEQNQLDEDASVRYARRR